MAIHVADLRYTDSGSGGPTVDTEGQSATVNPVTAGIRGMGSYRGLALHDLARLLPAAHGGQIFLSEAAEAVLRHDLPEGIAAVIDRGRYRLRDSPAPQHIFEALWDGASADAAKSPAPNAPAVRTPMGLPSSFTRFFGRDSEIATIADILTRDGDATRLLTLTGMGGAGKTRLAVEAARAASDRFDGAVWFVGLVGTDDPSRIPEAVRTVVVSPDSAAGSDDIWNALASTFGADSCLLVLDNLEHLLVSEGGGAAAVIADFLRELLERFPHVVCLATSRQRIGISAEQEFAVPPLPLPNPVRAAGALLAAETLEFASVALFEDRAKRARYDFQVTDRNVAAVAALCRRLEGIPLGLELAAAWVRLLTPAEMLVQFDEIRRSRDRDLPDRHRSLDAAIEGSYRLLDGEQSTFFRRLSVFRGGWTLDAAKDICDEPMALALLAELRDRSLIVVEERGESSRYRFLETVRTFAADRLAADGSESADAWGRCRDHFAALAAEANDALQGAGQADWLRRLADEHQNLTAVLERAGRGLRLKMAGHLHRYFMVRGYLPEARGFFTDVLTGDNTGIPDVEVNKAINVAGVLALTAGALDAARPLFIASAERCRAIGDERAAGAATINLGIIASQQGDYKAARAAYESTLDLWRRLDRRKTLATVLSNLGIVAKEQGDLETARTYLDESLELQDHLDDALLRANTLQNLGFVADARGDFAAANWFASESFKLRMLMADDRGIAGLLPMIASIQSRSGQPQRAAVIYGATETALALTGTEIMPIIRRAMESEMAQIRSAIGTTETERIWQRGRDMSWSQILEAALEAVKM